MDGTDHDHDNSDDNIPSEECCPDCGALVTHSPNGATICFHRDSCSTWKDVGIFEDDD